MEHATTSVTSKRSREAEADADDDDRPSKVRRSHSKAAAQHNAPNSQADERNQPYDFEEIITRSSFLEALPLWCEELTVPFQMVMLKRLSYDIKRKREHIPKTVGRIDLWFRSYPRTDSEDEQDALELLREAWETLRDEINKPLAPSTFCKSANWVEQQNGPAVINCRRPPEASGLPLNLLHPLFAKFLALIEGQPPDYSDPKFILAEQVATMLCQEMPEHFETEKARLDKFKSIASALFGTSGKELLGTVEVGQGQADLGLRYPEVGLVLVGEGKNEPGGSAGDPYMQVAASYNAWARRKKKETQTDTGCPCFVLCVDGPNILFGGGFRDNEISVVEPLSHWCVMMQHTELKRERDLARHLHALLHCLDDESEFTASLKSKTAYCPRIYDSFLTEDTKESAQLKFTGPFKNTWHNQVLYDLLFLASVEEKAGDGSQAKKVLVKVPSGSYYGSGPHVLAAKADFAPRLLGTAKLEGAPTSYVMELLSKSEGWFHLLKPERPKDITEQQKQRLREHATKFLSFLSENKLVHGDLRGCNVMCRLRDEDHVDFRVLDWDWAGQRGVARYPATLNPEAGYQGLPGGLIEAPHDEHMLSKTVDDFLPKSL